MVAAVLKLLSSMNQVHVLFGKRSAFLPVGRCPPFVYVTRPLDKELQGVQHLEESPGGLPRNDRKKKMLLKLDSRI